MLYLVTIALACVAALAFYLAYRWTIGYWSRHKGMPSVPGKIFGGNFWELITLKTHFGVHLKEIYDDPKFANEAVVGIYGLYRPSLLVRDPQLLKSIFITDFNYFTHRYMQPDATRDRISNLMLAFARLPFWREMRGKLTPFFSGAKLKLMYPLIQTVGDNLDAHLRRRGSRFVAEIKDLSSLFTIDVSCSTIFGVRVNSLENPQDPMVFETRCLLDFSWWRSFNHFFINVLPELSGTVRAQFFSHKTKEFVRSTISRVMAEREKSGVVRNDLIEIFFKLKQEAQANGSDMPTFMEGLYAQAAQFWIGGYGTTSSALSHALLELAKQPQLLDILRSEIREAFVRGNGDISYEALHKMQYLDMVVQETMRLYPLLGYLDRQYVTPKDAGQAYSLQPYHDYTLPEGMPIYISVHGLHYDEKYWPNPKKFDPERFSPSNRDKIQPMSFLPLGEGNRNCIGGRLGVMEVKVGLIHFLKNHYVRVCDKTTTSQDFNPKAMLIEIKGPIYLEVVHDDMCEEAIGSKKNI